MSFVPWLLFYTFGFSTKGQVNKNIRGSNVATSDCICTTYLNRGKTLIVHFVKGIKRLLPLALTCPSTKRKEILTRIKGGFLSLVWFVTDLVYGRFVTDLVYLVYLFPLPLNLVNCDQPSEQVLFIYFSFLLLISLFVYLFIIYLSIRFYCKVQTSRGKRVLTALTRDPYSSPPLSRALDFTRPKLEN